MEGWSHEMRRLAPNTILVRWGAAGTLLVLLVACTAGAGSDGPSPVSTATPAPAPSVSIVASSAVASPIAGCGTGESAFRDLATAVARILDFGDGQIELTTAGMHMRDGSYGADDAIPGFLGLTADEHAVHVRPGALVALQGDAMSFPTVRVTLVDWSRVRFPADGMPDDGGARVQGSAVIAADGSTAIVAPHESGDYLVELGIEWRTTCLQGDGVAYGRITVD
jgi:hypothetical protein